MNRYVITRFLAVSCGYLFADGLVPAAAQTAATTGTAATATVAGTTALPPIPTARTGTVSQQQRMTASFANFAGSEENAASLVGGLRSGGPITLTGEPSRATSLNFMPPTHRMGWGNVRHALTLAQRELAAQGITQPTPAQLRTALLGGSVVGATGRTATLPGILTLRSQGKGWGQIAHAAGVPMGNAASMPVSGRGQPLATTAGHRHVGVITTGTGDVVRSAHWSGEGAAQARIGADDGSRTMATSAPVSRPAVSTHVVTAAGEHGGFGSVGSVGHGRGH